MTKLLSKIMVFFVMIVLTGSTLMGCAGSGSGTSLDQSGSESSIVETGRGSESESTHREEISTHREDEIPSTYDDNDEAETTISEEVNNSTETDSSSDIQKESTEASGEDLIETEATTQGGRDEEEATSGEESSSNRQDDNVEKSDGATESVESTDPETSADSTEEDVPPVTSGDPPSTEAPTKPVVTLSSVSIAAKASEYEYGYQLTHSDLSVIARYSDGSSKTLTSGYTISQSGPSLHVTYNGMKSNAITVSYKAEETTEAPTTPVVTLSSVSIAAKASEYEYGYQLTRGDLSVIARYSDGSSKTLTSGYTISQSDTSLHVTYNGMKSNAITITCRSTVPNVLGMTYSEAKALLEAAGLNVVNGGEKYSVVYTAGQIMEQGFASGSVIPSGITVALIVSKGSLQAEEEEISSITVSANAAEYESGYQLTKSDLTVKISFADGVYGFADDYTISQSGDSLYVTYKGITSNTITIKYKSTTPIVTAVSVELKKDKYLFGSVITLNDLTVVATYSDGSTKVVTDGLTMYDHLHGGHTTVNSITLNEYDGNIYLGQAYYLSVAFDGVESSKIKIPCFYEDGAWLCQQMLALVNAARVEAGLHELHWDSAAEDEILIRVTELTVNYSHSRPNGESKEDLYYDFRGENINCGAHRERDMLQTIFNSWMNSAGHKACILNGSALTTGFVCAYCVDTNADGDQVGYWVMWTTFN